MRIVARPLPTVMLLEPEPRRDERGFFARCFCREELEELGIKADVVQANISFSKTAGTLRGMHYQIGPSAEIKFVQCVQGAIHDVVLDLRADSPSFGQSWGARLDDRNRRILVVPEGCAHGFLTLEPETLVHYLVTASYDPVRERGVRWDDPAFTIAWPQPPEVISDKDQSYPDFDPGYHLAA
ncbi:MAG: dTDP-4-dehydrorhamnose 3,5-epimerase [Pseudomonadota bacterium]